MVLMFLPSNTWDEASMILMIYYVLQASVRGLSFFNIGKCQLIFFWSFIWRPSWSLTCFWVMDKKLNKLTFQQFSGILEVLICEQLQKIIAYKCLVE